MTEENGDKASLRGRLHAYESVLIHLLAYLSDEQFEASKLILLHKEVYAPSEVEYPATEFHRSATIDALRELFVEAEAERQYLREND